MILKSGLFLTLAAFAVSASAESVPTITVYTTLAPNAFGSPSYDGWVANAISTLKTGAPTTAGTPGTPEFFSLITGEIPPVYLTVTSFPSWLGNADPANAYGAAFANELGNRGAFPLIVNGNGTQVRISDLSFTATSSDPDNALGFTFAAGDYTYNSSYQGILKGLDGILFTGDDVLISSGANTQLVDAIIGRGSGNAFWPCGPGDLAPCSTLAEKQADIDDTGVYFQGQTFTGTYTLGAASGSATITAEAPEPGTWLMMLTGLAGCGIAVRRRRAQ